MLNYIFEEEEVQWQEKKREHERERNVYEWWSLYRDKQLRRIMQVLHNRNIILIIFFVKFTFEMSFYLNKSLSVGEY